MKRSELSELHYITAISNVPSIMKHGILCYRNAKKIGHATVAMVEVQNRRARKRVPGAQLLHNYANLYLCARNPMLYKLKDLHTDLRVLRVDTDVLDLPEVVITDGNAASDYTRFWPSPVGLSKIDKDLVFAEFWTDQNQIVEWQKKRAKCAEVLVPDLVESSFVLGAYVSCGESLLRFGVIESRLSVTVKSYLFFR